MRINVSRAYKMAALAVLFGALFYLLFLFGEKANPDRTKASVVNNPAAENLTAAGPTYFGTIVKMETSFLVPGGLTVSHKLVDTAGQTLAYLESQEIDLKIVEGFKTTVTGRVARFLEGNLPLVEVEKVSFR